jgi:hypothetical protein
MEFTFITMFSFFKQENTETMHHHDRFFNFHNFAYIFSLSFFKFKLLNDRFLENFPSFPIFI